MIVKITSQVVTEQTVDLSTAQFRRVGNHAFYKFVEKDNGVTVTYVSATFGAHILKSTGESLDKMELDALVNGIKIGEVEFDAALKNAIDNVYN